MLDKKSALSIVVGVGAVLAGVALAINGYQPGKAFIMIGGAGLIMLFGVHGGPRA